MTDGKAPREEDEAVVWIQASSAVTKDSCPYVPLFWHLDQIVFLSLFFSTFSRLHCVIMSWCRTFVCITHKEEAAWDGVQGVWLHERRCDTVEDERVREKERWKRCRMKCTVLKALRKRKKKNAWLVFQRFSVAWPVLSKPKLQLQTTDGDVTHRSTLSQRNDFVVVYKH